MASVPVTQEVLETIVEVAARDLLEKWAIEDRFNEEELIAYTQMAVDDVAFTINRFMELMNEEMIKASLSN
jgi:hypothetical protein